MNNLLEYSFEEIEIGLSHNFEKNDDNNIP